MARTMDERCQIMREKFRAKFYEDVRQYEGQAFVNAWDWKITGEVGPLLSPEETFQHWKESRSGRRHYSDDRGEMHSSGGDRSST